MKIERRMLIIAAVLAFGIDFLYLVARNALQDHSTFGGDVFHTFLLLIGAGLFSLFTHQNPRDAEQNPLRTIGVMLAAGTGLLLLLGLMQLSTGAEFASRSGAFGPKNVVTVLVALILSIAALLVSIHIFLTIGDLIFIKRRRQTKRNFVFLVAAIATYLVLHAAMRGAGNSGGELSWLLTFVFILTIVAMLVNSFRFSWILVLTRREKLITLLLSFFGFVFLTMLVTDITVFSSDVQSGGFLHHALSWYHPLAFDLVSLVMLFAAIFMGICFASTLLHLPTAREFDRKKVELSSLQNLGRLVTQVFDFDELVGTSTLLALDVCEATAAWLEYANTPAGLAVIPSAVRGITVEQIDEMRIDGGRRLQTLVEESMHPVIIQDVQADRRLRGSKLHVNGIGAVALVPLRSHDQLIGMLGVVKKKSYEFDKDVLSVLYAFADMVAVALENSRLIAESLQRERFQQEIRLAQEMQRSLLPVLLPMAETYDLAASSTPAYEVGGDYYDAVQLDDSHLGITIGDVSGKGVSAALYMAQVKGIFQTLSGNGLSTRESLVRMNETLRKNMDRKSFISLIYGVLDIRSGLLRFSRAGHCPLLYISGPSARFLRPDGMGLGLSGAEHFSSSIEEEELRLCAGDLMVMYTDGITEAKNRMGEEFGAERLAATVEQLRNEPVETIMMSIFQAVKEHAGSGDAEDDMTVMVIRWKGKPSEPGAPGLGSGTTGHDAMDAFTHIHHDEGARA